jgi:Flp pilus assembly protein TadB
MIWLALAIAIGSGVGWMRVCLLAAALLSPVLTGVLVIGHCWLRRPRETARSALFCEAVSKELKTGFSVRQSIQMAADSVGATDLAASCRGSGDLGLVSSSAGATFGDIADELAALLRRSDGLGVRPAALFEELAAVALARSEVAHEVSVASAPAKATATVLLLVPLAVIGWTLGNGGFAPLLVSPQQRGVVLVGLALALTGLVAGGLVLRRSA